MRTYNTTVNNAIIEDLYDGYKYEGVNERNQRTVIEFNSNATVGFKISSFPKNSEAREVIFAEEGADAIQILLGLGVKKVRLIED